MKNFNNHLDRVWICAEEQRMNWTFAKAFDATYFCLADKRKGKSRIRGYLSCIKETISIIRKARPKIVFCQNPSVVISLLCTIIKPIYKYKLVTDTHNYSLESDAPLMVKILGRFIRKHSLSIISNEGLREKVESTGGRALVLPGKLPDLEVAEDDYVLFICTFSPDEPFEEVFLVAKELPLINFIVTGNYKKVNLDPSNYSSNIKFVGRVPWEEYDSILKNARFVLDLTTRENCLLMGAYEAVASEIPLILSNTNALRSYFYQGALFCKNEATDMKETIQLAFQIHPHLKYEIKRLKKDLSEQWQIQFEEINRLIEK